MLVQASQLHAEKAPNEEKAPDEIYTLAACLDTQEFVDRLLDSATMSGRGTGGKEGLRQAHSGLIYEETHGVLKNVIHDFVTYMQHARRKIVNAMGVVYTLKRQLGTTLYGFSG
ncbi:hypothetical protein ZIOFF_044850 [Zingiber officinale]|uniref:Histone H4 n=1 Tax=Zingiber officinale TaxID=94328 RepID=A0A8J5G6V8_ZINOF|nr:hypothetical protein ZIOFF_044850 [Zingiber officinale]